MITVFSPAFAANDPIPRQYTCDGEDENPPLEIAGVSANAKSLILIVDDPDAPVGTWTHWVVFNIPPSTSTIAENSVPDSARLGQNDFNRTAWGGPCPPSGAHRYFFKVFALDATLDLPDGVKRNELEKAMEGRVIDEGEVVGVYSRG